MRSIWDANEKLVGLMVYIGFLKEKNWYKIQEICEKLNEKLEMQQNLRKKIDLFFYHFLKEEFYMNICHCFIYLWGISFIIV